MLLAPPRWRGRFRQGSASETRTWQRSSGMARRSVEVIAAAQPDMHAAIAERAYYKAERRGFAPGYDMDDWLAAERELAASTVEPFAAAPLKAKRKTGVIKKLK